MEFTSHLVKSPEVFSRISCGSISNLSAIWSSLSGLNVPSVSIYIALPSPPPYSFDILSKLTMKLIVGIIETTKENG